MTHDEKAQVRRIIESAVATGNYTLAQTFITEAREFDVDFAMALQADLDQAMQDDPPRC